MKKSAGILLPFLVLLFVVMGCSEEARRQQREDAERQKQVDAQIAAREKFADEISKKFELPGSRRCVIDFFAEGDESKTLHLRACSFMDERGEKIKLHKVFDSGTMQEVKRLGFTKMTTKEGGETVYIPIE
jgi:hypothetical protein